MGSYPPGSSCRSVSPWGFGAELWKGYLLIAACWQLSTGRAAAPYTSAAEVAPPEVGYVERQQYQEIARQAQEQYRKRVALPEIAEEEVRNSSTAARGADSGGRSHARRMADSWDPIPTLLMVVFGGISSLLLLHRFAPAFLNSLYSRLNPWVLDGGSSPGRSRAVLAEERALAEFAYAFRGGSLPAGGNYSPAAAAVETAVAAATPAESLYQRFFAQAPGELMAARSLYQSICRGAAETELKAMLRDLGARIRDIKGLAGIPELLPMCQMTLALEGLIGQLTERVGRLTPSTLRTVGNCLDLLQDLAQPGVRPDLYCEPPIRLLAVDDDLISRQALFLALKKTLTAPDVASDGEAALRLVQEKPYDVIFLDVEMPGMDGYELCSRIHQTSDNSTTPVVFVTSHNDFDARAKSTLCGGHDLISKPFLVFELTVKALTFTLRKRLGSAEAVPDRPSLAANQTGLEGALPASTEAKSETAALPPKPVSRRQRRRKRRELAGDAAATAVGLRDDPVPSSQENTALAPDAAADGPLEAVPTAGTAAVDFVARAAALVPPIRELAHAINQTVDHAVRQSMLAELHLRVHCLAMVANLPELQPATQLASALEGLLKKLAEQPAQLNGSALKTIIHAVDLLRELYVPGVEAGLANQPSISLLVVDDDPVARRGMTGSLQMTFAKPDSVADAEAALALAEKKAFDVIFLDVQMPGMDGFAACPKIHQTAANRQTPVVFVTNHTDLRSRELSRLSGGVDFISKPFLRSEIKLKALTLALRGRLQSRPPAVAARN